VIAVLASEHAVFVNGVILPVDGGSRGPTGNPTCSRWWGKMDMSPGLRLRSLSALAPAFSAWQVELQSDRGGSTWPRSEYHGVMVEICTTIVQNLALNFQTSADHVCRFDECPSCRVCIGAMADRTAWSKSSSRGLASKLTGPTLLFLGYPDA
jgi:hypothetical protein